MTRKTNHVVPSKSDGWSVKKSGSIKASKNFHTKGEAVRYGRELSRSEKTELYIHKANGMIQDRNSYAHEPGAAKNRR